jgi:murein DD-endopeptidase MepM/ murein hydrolase activator NlpD
MKPLNPMPIVLEEGPGSFGYKRKFDIHTGIDLYCDDRAPVYCVEDGRVVNIENFTGESAQSPWWNETKAVLVESKSGVLVYGEIDVDESIHIGKNIKIGDILGYVIPVLKKDKGTPMCMLHFELYKHGTTSTVWWKLEDDKPSNLLNPTTLLKSL